jgi:uncharacterized protein involved in type VI secretion and phage assembly
MTSILDLILPRDEGADSRVFGVVTGVVTNNQDPEGLGRVKLKFPWLSDEEESDWARVATPMAGKERGLFLLPEVEDEVLVAFERGDVRYPYVIGSLWNKNAPPPVANDDGKNHLRVLKSRGGHVIRLNDEDGSESIEIVDMSEKHSIVISTKDNAITITSDGDVTVESKNGKLVLKGKNGVEITSGAALKAEAQGDAEIKASGQTTVKGSTINLN